MCVTWCGHPEYITDQKICTLNLLVVELQTKADTELLYTCTRTSVEEGGHMEQIPGCYLPRATYSSSLIFFMLSASFSYSRYSRKILTGSTPSVSSENRTVILVFSCLYFSNKARSFTSSLSSSLSNTAKSFKSKSRPCLYELP